MSEGRLDPRRWFGGAARQDEAEHAASVSRSGSIGVGFHGDDPCAQPEPEIAPGSVESPEVQAVKTRTLSPASAIQKPIEVPE